MKIIVGIARIFVGIFFMISGFIKLNDPVGFSFKLQEYFGESVLNLEFLIPYALWIALFIVIFELLVGLALVLGYARNFTRWSLLLMIVFFTFLTFYSAFTGKVTDCGCFGDALPLTPWESFWKDVGLLVLILLVFFNKKYLTPLFRPAKANKWIMLIALIACGVFANYVLNHLPVFDFRAYKVGVNIQEGMTPPKAVYEYQWNYLVDGKEKTIATGGAAPNVDGKLLGVETKLVSGGGIAPIHDFAMYRDGENYLDQFLKEDKLLIITAYDLAKSESEGWKKIKPVLKKARKNGYKVIGLSASAEKEIDRTKAEHDLKLQFYSADMTAIKTIVRSNPGLVKVNKGTITQKLHWNDAEELTVN